MYAVSPTQTGSRLLLAAHQLWPALLHIIPLASLVAHQLCKVAKGNRILLQPLES